MALPNPECEIPLDVCCDKAFLIADNILEFAHTAVVACLPESDCAGPPIVGYVSVGTRIHDPLSDYLVVSLESLTPSPGSADRHGRMYIPVYRATFQIELLESGWPTPRGDDEEIIPPTPDDYMQAAKHSYAHGEAMYRALHVALTKGELNPDCGVDCYKSIGPLVPIDPSGGSVGWETTITTDFDLNK